MVPDRGCLKVAFDTIRKYKKDWIYDIIKP